MVSRWHIHLRLGLLLALFAMTQSAFAAANSGKPQHSNGAVGAIVLADARATAAVTRPGAAEQTMNFSSYITKMQRYLDVTRAWLRQSYERSPEAIVGLAMFAVLPFLAIPFGLMRIVSRIANHMFRQRGDSGVEIGMPATTVESLSTAWLEVAHSHGSATRLPLDRPMLRIGRHDENDICIADASVRGYHALIYWSPEDAFQIRDLTAAEEAGVIVNGQPIDAASLRKGDLIELGDVRMRFATRHA